MNFEPSPIPQLARCVYCASDDVSAICHHCGRPLCSAHNNPLPEWNTDPRFAWLYLALQRLSERFFFRQVIPDFHRLRIPVEPRRGRYFDPGTYVYLYIGDDLHYLWEWIRYLFQRIWGYVSLFLLGLPNLRPNAEEVTAHCRACLHYATSFYPLVRAGFYLLLSGVALLLITALGLGITQNENSAAALPLPLFLCAAGSGLMLLGILLNLVYFVPEQRRSVPSFITATTGYGKLRVVENIDGEIHLDAAGKYTVRTLFSQATPLTGEVQANVTLNERTYQSVNLFYQKAGFLGIDSTADHIHLGTLLLNGTRWQIIETAAARETYGDWVQSTRNGNAYDVLVPSSSPAIAPFLQSGVGTHVFQTKRDFCYPHYIEELKKVELPFQMVVSFSRSIEKRALEIEIEITEPDAAKTKPPVIGELKLEIPNGLGKVAFTNPLGKIERAPTGNASIITWQGLFYETSKAADKNGAPKNPRKSISIQFQNELPDLQTLSDDSVLTGKIELSIPLLTTRKTVYRATTRTGRPFIEPPKGGAVLLFNAFGNKHDTSAVEQFETHATATFRLDLRGLRLGKTIRYNKPLREEVKGIAPNNLVLAKIIDKLNEQKTFYIKRVTENPPPVSRENAQKTQHYWDIHGRTYEGVFPIDFHIVCTGEEVGYDSAQNTFFAEVNTEAVVTNKEMEEKAVEALDRLVELIENAVIAR